MYDQASPSSPARTARSPIAPTRGASPVGSGFSASSSAARARWPGRCSEDGFPTIHAASVQAASASGRSVPISELVHISDSEREQPIYHKDLLPVDFVQGDMAGRVDSPLYGMFAMRSDIARITAPGGSALQELFVDMPQDAQRHYSLRWDGE